MHSEEMASGTLRNAPLAELINFARLYDDEPRPMVQKRVAT